VVDPIRIPPEEVRKKVLSGEALFICAYEDEEKFRRMHLEGAVSFNEFKAKTESLTKEQELIFYCA
jgi:rhodanese-related sulfurtransferase